MVPLKSISLVFRENVAICVLSAQPTLSVISNQIGRMPRGIKCLRQEIKPSFYVQTVNYG